MGDQLATAANVATVVSVALSIGVLGYRWYQWETRREKREKYAREAPQRQAASERVIRHFTSNLGRLDGQLSPEQLHVWLRAAFDDPDNRESAGYEQDRLTSSIDRMVCWAKLRRAYASREPLIGGECSAGQVEDYIRQRMGHDRPVSEVEASGRCLEAWIAALHARKKAEESLDGGKE